MLKFLNIVQNISKFLIGVSFIALVGGFIGIFHILAWEGFIVHNLCQLLINLIVCVLFDSLIIGIAIQYVKDRFY